MRRRSDSVIRLLVSINWLLVVVGGLLVGQTAHILFSPPSQFEKGLVPAQRSALSPSLETTVSMSPPVPGVDDSFKPSAPSTRAVVQGSSTSQPRPSSPAKGKTRPTRRAPNPDRPDYDRALDTEADRLGL